MVTQMEQSSHYVLQVAANALIEFAQNVYQGLCLTTILLYADLVVLAVQFAIRTIRRVVLNAIQECSLAKVFVFPATLRVLAAAGLQPLAHPAYLDSFTTQQQPLARLAQETA